MCDHCHETPSRRSAIKMGLAAAAAAALAACGPEQTVDDLPDVYQDHLVNEEPGGAVRIDPKKIIIPPATKPAQTEYGAILPRSAWTSSPLELRKGIPMGSIGKITIHHSGDGKKFLGESIADVARHLQIVEQAHLQRGMIDIAYHFAVDPVGRVWQLRWLQYEGQHVRPSKNGMHNNPHNVGVVVLGDFNLQNVPAAQGDRVVGLARLIRSKYALTASAVYMHGEIVDTDCPGKTLKPVIEDARRRRTI